MANLSRNFSIQEFDSPDLPGSGANMSPIFMTKLQDLRDEWGDVIRITSGFRTANHNVALRAKGYKASKNSYHLKGFACDVDASALNSRDRFEFIQLAISLGFTGIGISPSFIHLDIRPIPSLWTY